MNHITEILPDLEDMPDWAREAFEAGQLFDVAFKRVEGLEQQLREARKCVAALRFEAHQDDRVVLNLLRELQEILRNMTNEIETPYPGKPDPRDDTVKPNPPTLKKHTQMLGGERVSYDCPACFDAGGFPQPCAACGVIRVEVTALEARKPDHSLRTAVEMEDTVPDNAWPLDNCPPETAGDRLQEDHTPLPDRGPRITTTDIDMAIATAQRVDFYRFPYTSVTTCCVVLANGFAVVGYSAAVSPENYDMEIGRRCAMEDVENKLWELLGFRLKQALFEGPVAKG